jgi:hypothetical protein
VVEDPRQHPAASRTASLAERNYSFLCAPILDPIRHATLAVIYVSGTTEAYGTADREWVGGVRDIRPTAPEPGAAGFTVSALILLGTQSSSVNYDETRDNTYDANS